jgi:hypothetical protein
MEARTGATRHGEKALRFKKSKIPNEEQAQAHTSKSGESSV